MILFDIKCSGGHVFEAWFQNNDVFETQVASDLVECPLCGCTKTSKSLMAPNISAKGKSDNAMPDISIEDHPDHPVMVSNSKYWMGPDIVAARGLRSKVRDYGRVWDFGGKSAEVCAIDWSGPGTT